MVTHPSLKPISSPEFPQLFPIMPISPAQTEKNCLTPSTSWILLHEPNRAPVLFACNWTSRLLDTLEKILIHSVADQLLRPLPLTIPLYYLEPADYQYNHSLSSDTCSKSESKAKVRQKKTAMEKRQEWHPKKDVGLRSTFKIKNSMSVNLSHLQHLYSIRCSGGIWVSNMDTSL